MTDQENAMDYGQVKWLQDKITELEKRIEALESKPKRTRFQPPTLDEVVFCMMGCVPGDDHSRVLGEAENFIDFYKSKNWMVGKNKMKDWPAAARRWIRRTNDEKRTGTNGQAFTRESRGERASRLAREHLSSDSI